MQHLDKTNIIEDMAYTQLNIEEREVIQQLHWEKRSIRYIARVLGRAPSTISREFNRTFPPQHRVYTPRIAQERAEQRIRERGRRPRLKEDRVRRYVERKLTERRWSPEQIAGRMHRLHPDWPTVSYEAIYQYVYAPYGIDALPPHGDLRSCLRRHHRIRKKKGVMHGNRGSIAGRISIEERPAEVATRATFGHWEHDSIVSRKSLACLNSLVERKSGLLKLTKIANGTAQATAEAVEKRLHNVPERLRLTATVDNGHENADHRKVSAHIGIQYFFCHPYTSQERGTNENTNGLVREYFPKGTDFAKVSAAEVVRVEALINCRPRKRLAYLTPLEVFKEAVALKG